MTRRRDTADCAGRRRLPPVGNRAAPRRPQRGAGIVESTASHWRIEPDMQLAIILTCRNAAPTIEAALARLEPLRRRGAAVIVVDGGSRDDTVRRAAHIADLVISAPAGRALQMNAGARAIKAQSADVLLFIDPDTVLPADADRLIFRGLSNSPSRWGRFDLQLAGRSPWLPRLARGFNTLSRITGLCGHQQALFVERGSFLALEGFAPIARFEDLEFCLRARRICSPLAVAAPVVASGQSLERAGLARAIVVGAALRLAFCLGADVDQLARRVCG
jgi:glycosyltransferase involved in cell wall biosynthesis